MKNSQWLPAAFLLDMDGVLYHGNTVLPDAREFMQVIESFRHTFVTNNPIHLPEQIADRLAAMGFTRPDPVNIVTSGIATADWLAKQKPGFHYFAIGAKGLHQALSMQGIEDKHEADFVVVGEGPGLNYDSLTIAINLILDKKAQFIVSNPDTTVDGICEGKRCALPGAGALAAPLQVATGVEPVIIGKPNPLLFEMALARLKIPPEECLMIGDRPDTDILGAQSLGIKTALVRTGCFRAEQSLPENIHPDYDVPNLAALLLALKFT